MALTGAFERVGNATQFNVSEGSPSGLCVLNNVVYMRANNRFYRLDVATGIATRIGSSNLFPTGWASGSGLTTHNGKIYTAAFDSRFENVRFYEINPTTGRATRVGSLQNFGASITNPSGFASFGGKLYLASRSGANVGLNTVNPTTGQATMVGDSGWGITITNSSAIAAFDGKLYLISLNTLYVLDVDTGNATRVGNVDPGFSVGENSARGLTEFNSKLYMVGSQTDALYVAVEAVDKPTFTAPTGQTVREGQRWTLDLSDYFDGDPTSYAFQSAYTKPAYLELLGTSLNIATAPEVTQDTTISILVQATNVGGTTPGTVTLVITDTPPPPPEPPTFTAPTGETVSERGRWTLDLATVFSGATSYAFQSGYTKPDYLELSGSVLTIANAPTVTQDTTIGIRVQGINQHGTTRGTVTLIITNIAVRNFSGRFERIGNVDWKFGPEVTHSLAWHKNTLYTHNRSNLYAINTDDGTVGDPIGTLVNWGLDASPNLVRMRHIHSAGNTLYGVTQVFTPVGPDRIDFVSIDPITGRATIIANWESGDPTDDFVYTGHVLGWDGTTMFLSQNPRGASNPRELWTVDVSDGSLTKVADFKDGEHVQAMAWDGSTFYVGEGFMDALYTMDKQTAQLDRLGYSHRYGLNSFSIQGLAWDGTNLWGVQSPFIDATQDSEEALARAIIPTKAPTYITLPAQQVTSGGALEVDLSEFFIDETSFAFQPGYTAPSYLTLTNQWLRIENVPLVSEKTTITVLLQASNHIGTTTVTVPILIVPAPERFVTDLPFVARIIREPNQIGITSMTYHGGELYILSGVSRIGRIIYKLDKTTGALERLPIVLQFNAVDIESDGSHLYVVSAVRPSGITPIYQMHRVDTTTGALSHTREFFIPAQGARPQTPTKIIYHRGQWYAIVNRVLYSMDISSDRSGDADLTQIGPLDFPDVETAGSVGNRFFGISNPGFRWSLDIIDPASGQRSHLFRQLNTVLSPPYTMAWDGDDLLAILTPIPGAEPQLHSFTFSATGELPDQTTTPGGNVPIAPSGIGSRQLWVSDRFIERFDLVRVDTDTIEEILAVDVPMIRESNLDIETSQSGGFRFIGGSERTLFTPVFVLGGIDPEDIADTSLEFLIFPHEGEPGDPPSSIGIDSCRIISLVRAGNNYRQSFLCGTL